jgi:hypothetical protein
MAVPSEVKSRVALLAQAWVRVIRRVGEGSGGRRYQPASDSGHPLRGVIAVADLNGQHRAYQQSYVAHLFQPV